MNARETLQALLDGETIISSNGYIWKLDECNELVQKKPERRKWEHAYLVFNGGCEIYKEYPFTFEQALYEMLKGKTMMHESCEEYRYRFYDGRFESSYDDDEWEMCGVGGVMQTDRWKVVE